jgi:hypothetical protein
MALDRAKHGCQEVRPAATCRKERGFHLTGGERLPGASIENCEYGE